jgi:hypothetical protein
VSLGRRGFDKFQHQRIALPLVMVNREQQPVALIKSGSVQIVADFFNLSRFEVIVFQIFFSLAKPGMVLGLSSL